MLPDYHMHTPFCRHAHGEPEEYAAEAVRKGLKEIYLSPLILNLAWERGIPISFGSDAHGPQDVGRYFDQALKLAKDAGYTHCLRMRGRKKELVPLPGG